MGGSDTTQTTQSQQVNQLPPWINTAAQQNYALAQNVASQPLQQYQGQLVANMGPQTQQAINAAAQSGNAGADQYNASNAGYLGVMGQQPQQVTPGQLSSTNLQPYMNPYTSSVINSTLPIMQQNLGLQQNQQQNAANAANAFGGSRQAIQQGVTQAQGAQKHGAEMAAQLNQSNFGQAQAAAQQDINTSMRALQTANQGAQQNQANLNLQAATGLHGNLGQQAQRSQLQNFGELTTAGGGPFEQQQAQNQINAQLGQFQQMWQYPYQQLSVLQSALGMTPYESATQGQSTTQTQQSADPMAANSGGMGMLGGLFTSPGRRGRDPLRQHHERVRRRLRPAHEDRHHQGRPAPGRRAHLQLPLQGRQQDLPESGRPYGRGRGQDRSACGRAHPRRRRQDGGQHGRAERPCAALEPSAVGSDPRPARGPRRCWRDRGARRADEAALWHASSERCAGMPIQGALEVADGDTYAYLSGLSAHPTRPGDTSNFNPTFATALANSIRQARAAGLNVGLESGFREPGQTGSAYDAGGNSSHTYGLASDISGLDGPNGKATQQWAQIATANGLHNPYGIGDAKEFNHWQLPEQPLEQNPQLLASLKAAKATGDFQNVWSAYNAGGGPQRPWTATPGTSLFTMPANAPMGMRKNNPLNIKFYSGAPYEGLVGPSANTDQGDPQMVFKTPEQGWAAAYSLLNKKYGSGMTTPNMIIAGKGGWTPGNTQAAANVAKSAGIGPDDDIGFSDPAKAQKFMRALVTQEQGGAASAYPDTMIAGAVSGKPAPATGSGKPAPATGSGQPGGAIGTTVNSLMGTSDKPSPLMQGASQLDKALGGKGFGAQGQQQQGQDQVRPSPIMEGPGPRNVSPFLPQYASPGFASQLYGTTLNTMGAPPSWGSGPPNLSASPYATGSTKGGVPIMAGTQVAPGMPQGATAQQLQQTLALASPYSMMAAGMGGMGGLGGMGGIDPTNPYGGYGYG